MHAIIRSQRRSGKKHRLFRLHEAPDATRSHLHEHRRQARLLATSRSYLRSAVERLPRRSREMLVASDSTTSDSSDEDRESPGAVVQVQPSSAGPAAASVSASPP